MRLSLIAVIAVLAASGCAGDSPPPRTQAEISVRQGGQWEGQKYVGGEWANVDDVIAPPQLTDHSEYIRYEGPGIESDLVGYRFYLDWRNGFDIYGKKTHALVLQDVGLDGYESYHEPADWGMDILSVGDSLGIGGYGYWDGAIVHRVADVEQRSARVIENGPDASQLELRYDGWHVADATTDLVARLSMQGGSRLVHVQLEMMPALDSIAIGIVKHADADVWVGEGDNGQAFLATWGPQSIIGDRLGMLLIFSQADVREVTADEHSHVVVLEPQGGKLDYWFGAAWEQEPGGITTEDAFHAYVRDEVAKRAVAD